MPAAEISYDEAVTAAKVLYEKIVGSDDDFFDVDFEDEDDSTKLSEKTYQMESAIIDDEDDDVDMTLDTGMSAEPVEFAGEMEI